MKLRATKDLWVFWGFFFTVLSISVTSGVSTSFAQNSSGNDTIEQFPNDQAAREADLKYKVLPVDDLNVPFFGGSITTFLRNLDTPIDFFGTMISPLEIIFWAIVAVIIIIVIVLLFNSLPQVIVLAILFVIALLIRGAL